MKKKVLLGMSGGIDSSVAAMLLLDQGFDVTGITYLFSTRKQEEHVIINAAKEVANAVGIDHFTVDLRKEFDELIISYF